MTNKTVFLALASLAITICSCSQSDTSISKRLKDLDTTLTSKEIMSQTLEFQKAAIYNPSELDKMAEKMYQFNESKDYRKALVIGKEILEITPNNITGLKESSFAYSKLQKKDSSEMYLSMMIKCIKAVQSVNDGSYNSPYLLNNSFELTSIIEATYGLYPEKSIVMKDSKNKVTLLKMAGRIAVKFAQLDHWGNYLKEDEYEKGDLKAIFREQNEKTNKLFE